MYDRNMFRSYSDKNYVSTTTVNHNGTTVAFAMDDQRKIYYSVLNLDTADRGPIDAVYWNATPGLLPFPDEIIDIAPQATTTMTLPVVKRGSRTESQPDLLAPDEVDPFLSTTARFTAAVPFPVVSDGRYLLVFRQSISATDGDRVYQRAGWLLSADLSHTDFTQVNGANVAAVDGSLLVDRFVLAGSQLRPVVEPRYQRSRSKFAPASAGDTIGTRDMQGRLFYEPTLKLSFVSKLSRGAFSATLLPTAASGVSRWQIFAPTTRPGGSRASTCRSARTARSASPGSSCTPVLTPGTSRRCSSASRLPTRTPGCSWYRYQRRPTGRARRWHVSADIKTSEDLNLPTPVLARRPGDSQRLPEIVVVEPSSDLVAYVAELGERAGKIRNRAVRPEEDNMLKVTGDGRKAALDLRLVGLPT